MSWLSNLFPSFLSHDTASDINQLHCPSVNPATGLPMANCSIDVAGNPYGTSFMSDDYLNTSNNVMDDVVFNDPNDSFNSWSDDDSWGSNSWDNT